MDELVNRLGLLLEGEEAEEGLQPQAKEAAAAEEEEAWQRVRRKSCDIDGFVQLESRVVAALGGWEWERRFRVSCRAQDSDGRSCSWIKTPECGYPRGVAGELHRADDGESVVAEAKAKAKARLRQPGRFVIRLTKVQQTEVEENQSGPHFWQSLTTGMNWDGFSTRMFYCIG